MSNSRFDTSNLERLLNRPLEQEEVSQIELWEKGNALRQITPMYGWQVALEMLQSYVTKALAELAQTDPKEREEVLAQQAVAFAANKIFSAFQYDVAQAVEASKKPPEVITEQLKHATSGLPQGL